MELVEMVRDGETITLVCFCHPLPCHGEVIKDAIFKIIQQESKDDV
jgi:hypothetical protein